MEKFPKFRGIRVELGGAGRRWLVAERRQPEPVYALRPSPETRGVFGPLGQCLRSTGFSYARHMWLMDNLG